MHARHRHNQRRESVCVRGGQAKDADLEQAREARVAVRNVRALAVHKGGDDVAERRQGQVDLDRLGELLAFRARLGLPLRALPRSRDGVSMRH